MNRRVLQSPQRRDYHDEAPDADMSVELGETDKRRRIANEFMTLTGDAEYAHDTLTASSRKDTTSVPVSNKLVECCAGRVTAWLATLLNGASSWEARHKRWSLWYSVNAFATAATAALVVFFALQGLGGGGSIMSSGDTVVVDASSRARSDSLVIGDESAVSGVAVVSAVSPASRLLEENSWMTHPSLLPDKRALEVEEKTEGDAPPRRARVGYLVMTSGMEELQRTKRLLKAVYDPNNFYLVHLDRKDNGTIRGDLENFIKDWENVRMLVPALDVSWGGYTITLTAIFGICTLVQWSDEWDYFVNLSASDFPLMPQAELTEVLGQYMDVGMNFVSGEPLNERNRVEVLIDDQGLYREKQSSKAGRPLKVAKPRLPPSKSMFTVYKGEFWLILHRSFCRYLEASPDNVARSLQAYFSRFRISDESYFQTVLCHPLAPSFPVYSDNMRFVSWPTVSEGYYVLHPDPITNANVRLAMKSGALFARKFDLKVSQEAYTLLEDSLSKPNSERVDRAVQRLAPAAAVVGRKGFCAIPEGYSIQEVLSHPPKSAMQTQQARNKPEVSVSKGSTESIIPAKPNPQTRETMEGKGSTP